MVKLATLAKFHVNQSLKIGVLSILEKHFEHK